MGNSQKRPGTVPKPFQKIEKNLAPKEFVESDHKANECPICFLNYVALNSVSCCKQMICTECYLSLNKNSKSTCPYCGQMPFLASYSRSLETSLENNPNEYVTSVSEIASLNSNKSFSKPIPIMTLSKKDREELEKDIMNQRNQFSEDFPPPSFESRSSGNRSSSSRVRSDTNPEDLGNSFGDLLINDFNHFLHLEQLEEIMLNEAIRQSMLLSSPNSPQRNRNNSSNEIVDDQDINIDSIIEDTTS